MNRFRTIALILLIVATLAAGISATEPVSAENMASAMPMPPDIDPAFAKILTYDYGQSPAALQAIAKKIEEAGADKARRAALEKQMLLVLTSKAPLAAKRSVAKLLSRVASSNAIPTLTTMLPQEDLSLMARSVLERMGTPDATAALRDSLPRVSGKLKAGVINSLGALRDKESVGALDRLLGDADPVIAASALAALGRIGGPEAARALASFRAPRSLQSTVADARLACAERLAADGKRSEAMAIYRALNKPEQSRAARRAAQYGLLNLGSREAVAILCEMLASENPDTRTATVPYIAKLSGTDALRGLIAALPNLPPPAQVVLVGALGAAADKSAGPAVLAAAKSNDAAVRLAAIRALGTVGDATAVPVLIEGVAAGGKARDAAIQSLRAVFGQGTDEVILDALEDADANVRAVLIDVLAARKTTAAIPVLLAQVRDKDADVRGRAIAALGELTGPKDVPELLKLLLNTKMSGQRDAVAKVIVLACKRTADLQHQADPVLAVLKNADETERCLLIPVIGRIGGKEALEAVHAALASGNPVIHEAGVRGLCNWPDAGAAAELWQLADNADNAAHRIWALRGYIRVVTLPSDRSPQESLIMLKRAMRMATRNKERNLVLSRAAAVRDIETLRFVAPYLDTPALATEASRAVLKLAHHRALFAPNRDEFIKVLEKVIAVCKDPSLVQRAGVQMGLQQR